MYLASCKLKYDLKRFSPHLPANLIVQGNSQQASLGSERPEVGISETVIPHQGHSGTVVVNDYQQDASGTLVVKGGISGTVLYDRDAGGTMVFNQGGTVQAGGEDFAAALRSNAPTETSG